MERKVKKKEVKKVNEKTPKEYLSKDKLNKMFEADEKMLTRLGYRHHPV